MVLSWSRSFKSNINRDAHCVLQWWTQVHCQPNICWGRHTDNRENLSPTCTQNTRWKSILAFPGSGDSFWKSSFYRFHEQKQTQCMFNRCFFTLKIKKSPTRKNRGPSALHSLNMTLLEAIACARYLSISVLLRMFDPKDLQKKTTGWPGVRLRDQRCP